MKQLRFTFIVLLLSFFYFSFSGKQAEAAVVNPNQVYTYEKMEQDIMNLANTYPDLVTYKVIGQSEYGRNIYAVSLGKGHANVFINGSHHGREWLTTTLNMYMIDQYAAAYESGTKISGYDARSILDKTTIWFVPMVNPDGVTLQQYGLKAFPSSVHQDLIKMNDGSKDFKRWKANAKGVDLNRQYNADWANIKYNPGKPYYKNYKGTKPHSALEVIAVLNFVNEIDPEATVAYHSTGEILYWNFHQTGSWYNRDHNYAKKIGEMTGYRLVYPGPNPSGGGFTDWFIIQYKRPGFTPEISRYYKETSPPLSEFPRAWTKNQAVGLYIADLGYQLNQARMGTIKKEADNKIAQAITKSKGLRFYYSGNIKSAADLVVDAKFAKAYQEANKSIAAAEKQIKALPEKERAIFTTKLNEAYSYKNSAAVFIDTVKIGQTLLLKKQSLDGTVNNGILNDDTVKSYHDLSYQIKKSEIFINKMYGSHVRPLTANQYVLPAKITKETIIYEISRYMVTKEIQVLLQEGTLEEIPAKFEKLEKLEQQSIGIKELGNKLHPGKYPDLPKFEETLQSMKEEVLKQYSELQPVVEEVEDSTEESTEPTPTEEEQSQNSDQVESNETL
ncbi:M14 family zinc carboxypeptidase [Cytobacillus sp. FJAT-54145]|uniref:M14 family zinc carboxypeptidase n=1 Tax=Cytobacillus spartinae TaxID=3299023 RepID=A0ABW6KFQ4_9BACI